MVGDTSTNKPADMIRSFLVSCDHRMIEGVANHVGGTSSLLVLRNNDAHAIGQICAGQNLAQKGATIVSSQLPNGQVQVRAVRAYRAIGSEDTIFTAGVGIDTHGQTRMFGGPVGEDHADGDSPVSNDEEDDDGVDVVSGRRAPRASARSRSTPKAKPKAKEKTKAKAKPKAKVKAKSKAKACSIIGCRSQHHS